MSVWPPRCPHLMNPVVQCTWTGPMESVPDVYWLSSGDRICSVCMGGVTHPGLTYLRVETAFIYGSLL